MFTLIFSLLLSVSAHAKLTAVCGVLTGESHYPVPELIETPIDFRQAEGNEFRSQSQFKFAKLPNHTFYLNVYEYVESSSLKWTLYLTVRNATSSDIVGRGEKNVTVGGAYVACHAFDKTETLTLPAAPSDLREQLRRKYLKGLAPVREYVQRDLEFTELETGDAYDLYLQLLAKTWPGSDRLKSVTQDLIGRGFRLKLRDEENGAIRGSGQLESGREIVKLDVPYSGGTSMKTGTLKPTEFSVQIKVQILRDPRTRLIQGYRILNVKPEDSGHERGGTASTSGGR